MVKLVIICNISVAPHPWLEFKVGCLVWGKVSGWPYFPAVVQNTFFDVDEGIHKYTVIFFGWRSTGYVFPWEIESFTGTDDEIDKYRNQLVAKADFCQPIENATPKRAKFIKQAREALQLFPSAVEEIKNNPKMFDELQPLSTYFVRSIH